jgi:hypothetical protein
MTSLILCISRTLHRDFKKYHFDDEIKESVYLFVQDYIKLETLLEDGSPGRPEGPNRCENAVIGDRGVLV